MDAKKCVSGYVWTLDKEEYEGLSEDYCGGCIKCGAISDGGVEPDASNYECDSCGKQAVYGFENLVLMGHVKISD